MRLLRCSELFPSHGHALQQCRSDIDGMIRRYLAGVSDREEVKNATVLAVPVSR
mgnify:FL=1